MSEHTPGPWEAVGCLVRTTPYANERGGLSGGFLIAEAPMTDDGRADATLISAAPDLLAALKEIVSYEGGAESALDDDYVMARVMAAIVKAEGGAK